MLKDIFSWVNSKLEVRKVIGYDQGVFATQKIKKGEILSVFGGYVMTILEENKLPSKKLNDSGVQISENLVLSSKKNNEFERANCFNHSCNPNAGINGQIFLVAMRDINSEEQITFDYAMCLHAATGVKEFKMKCLCGSKNCRGFITENDWMIPALQKKYRGYFQCYLENKIKILKSKKLSS